LELGDDPEKIIAVFDRAVAFAKEGDEKARILVNCKMGVSRSAAVVLALLVNKESTPLQAAYAHLKSRRPFIEPSTALWVQLARYECRCHKIERSTMGLREYVEIDLRAEFGSSLDTTLWHMVFEEVMTVSSGQGVPESIDFYFAYQRRLTEEFTPAEPAELAAEATEELAEEDEATEAPPGEKAVGGVVAPPVAKKARHSGPG